MLATLIPEPRRGSTRKRAWSLMKRAYKALKKNGNIPEFLLDQFWNVHADLANRGYPLHRCLSRRIIEAEWNMDYYTKKQTLNELRDIRNDLVAINKRRKEKLALCGVSKV
jgi:hypothetical protein